MKVLNQDQRLHSNNRWSEDHHFSVNGSDWQIEPQLAVAAVESRQVVGMVQSWTSSQQKWTELMVFNAHVEPTEHVTGEASVLSVGHLLVVEETGDIQIFALT